MQSQIQFHLVTQNWLEPDIPEPPKPFHEELLLKVKEKQAKHLTSMSQSLSSVQLKWGTVYRFEWNRIAARSVMETNCRNITDVNVIELFRDVPKSIKIHKWEQMENLAITFQW